MSTAAATIDAVCQFFGGAYDATTKTYHTPTVAGIGAVRRAWPREDLGTEYFQGLATGTATGCVIVVQITDIHDGPRVALPAIQGRRFVRYGLDLNCFFLSKALFVEDCADAVYALKDAITVKMRTDPTLGTGGFENTNGLGFQVGEGQGEITTQIQQGDTIDGLTKAFMQISFEAHAYDVG